MFVMVVYILMMGDCLKFQQCTLNYYRNNFFQPQFPLYTRQEVFDLISNAENDKPKITYVFGSTM